MNDAPDPRARRRTAFHEAGHAIVAWALGLKVGWVRLFDDHNGEAQVDVDEDLLPFVDQVALAMGGWYGSNMSGVELMHDNETREDQAKVLKITYRAFPDDPDARDVLYIDGCNRAEEILELYADQVATIAGELERHDLPP